MGLSMRPKLLSLVLLLVAVCPAESVIADATQHAIDQLIILVHPCPYEALGKPEDDPYRTLERAACDRWFLAIPSLPPSTFVIQVDFAIEGPSPDKLHTAFIDRLGEGRVCRVPCVVTSPEEPDPLKDYYTSIHQQIARRITDGKLKFDPSTCKTFVWGQSFEGCAAGFGSAIASGLGLKTPTRLDYAMSAPDAEFLLDSKFIRNIPVPNSDIEAYLFDLNDGRCAAFFRSALTPQWLDHRPIHLQIDSKTFSVLTKQGHQVWPTAELPTDTPAEQTRYNQWRPIAWPKGTQPSGPKSFTLSTVQERYVVTAKPHMRALISAIKSAVVKP